VDINKYFQKLLKRDKNDYAVKIKEKIKGEIIKKEYTLKYGAKNPYNIHYQNVIFTKGDLTDFELNYLNNK